MTFPKARVIVSGGLFVAWLGFLVFLILDSNTIILSRPQFLIAQLYVVADIKNDHGRPDPDLRVEEVVWAANPQDRELKAITLPELAEAKKQHGYAGPGRYLLPLQKKANGTFVMAPMPRTALAAADFKIYPWTAGTKRQLQELLAAREAPATR